MTRKAKFSIVTNEMSEQVYQRLMTKVKHRELTPYIIELVNNDINKEKSLYDKIESLEQQMKEMNMKMNNINVVHNDENETSLTSEFRGNDEIKAELDEDPDEAMDF